MGKIVKEEETSDSEDAFKITVKKERENFETFVEEINDPSVWKCADCNVKFRTRKNYRIHTKRKHPEILDILFPPVRYTTVTDNQNKSTCPICKSTFSRKKTMKDHVRKKHPEKAKMLFPERNIYRSFKCDKCNATFSWEKTLKIHRKTHDPPELHPDISKKICPICSVNLSKRRYLDHFINIHNITIEVENLEFSSLNDFNHWKNSVENESQCSYIAKSGSKKKKGGGLSYTYNCHRSGYYTPIGTKCPTTKKINAYCPSNIFLVIKSDGSCSVRFRKTHVGHENESCLPHERKSILVKIPSEVVVSDDEVPSSSSKWILKQLPSRIVPDSETFNLDTNDMKPINAWVHEMRVTDDSFILYYKPLNVLCDVFTSLTKEDFLLIVMNKAQMSLFKELGNDCVCLDSTHGTNSNKFELISLLVLDELREGFPCAFFFTNRVDEVAIEIFLVTIRGSIGFMSPKVFMSSMNESFFDVWKKVMNSPEFNLYCTWHISHAWRKNLIKIKEKGKQVEVYKILRSLLVETDIDRFKTRLNAALIYFSKDEDYAEFNKFFTKEFTSNTTEWAYCYRKSSGLNTNLHIERIHRAIKYIYLRSKHSVRVDIAINGIMKYLKKHFNENSTVFKKGQLNLKLQTLSARHKDSMKLSLHGVADGLEGSSFLVQSCPTEELHLVQKNITDCACDLVCKECNTCIHIYSCTCLDSSFRWNMCKHIHLVCRYLNSCGSSDYDDNNYATENHNSSSSDMENDDYSDIPSETLLVQDSNVKQVESSDIKMDTVFSVLEENPSQEVLEPFLCRKERLKNEMLKLIDKISSEEELNRFETVLSSANSIFNVTECTTSISYIFPAQTTEVYYNI